MRVVLLLHNGQHLSSYYQSFEEAVAFVTGWRDRQCERIANGKFNEVETSLLQGTDREGNCTWAVMAPSVIGMYIPDDSIPMPQERMATAMEKLVEENKEGEEWKA